VTRSSPNNCSGSLYDGASLEWRVATQTEAAKINSSDASTRRDGVWWRRIGLRRPLWNNGIAFYLAKHYVSMLSCFRKPIVTLSSPYSPAHECARSMHYPWKQILYGKLCTFRALDSGRTLWRCLAAMRYKTIPQRGERERELRLGNAQLRSCDVRTR